MNNKIVSLFNVITIPKDKSIFIKKKKLDINIKWKKYIIHKSHSSTIFSPVLQQFCLFKEIALIVSKDEYQIMIMI